MTENAAQFTITLAQLNPTVGDVTGNAAKARAVLGWRPKMSFKDLVQVMVDSDLELARREASSPR